MKTTQWHLLLFSFFPIFLLIRKTKYPSMNMQNKSATQSVKIFLCGDVMLGSGIDQNHFSANILAIL